MRHESVKPEARQSIDKAVDGSYNRNFQDRPTPVSTVTDADLDVAVQEFLETADTVFYEYEQGYMDADAALRRLDTQLDSLREASDRVD